MYAIRCLCLLILCPILCASQSHNNHEPADTQQQSTTEQRGSENAPFVVKIENSEHAQPATTPNANQSQNGRAHFFSNGDIVILIVGTLQFLVLCVTVGVMIVNGRRQLRAYVLPENGSVLDGTMMTPPQPYRDGIPGCWLLLKNSGQTPAYNVVSWFDIAVIRVANESTALIVPAIQDKFSLTLGTGNTFTKSLWFDRALAVNEIADIQSGDRAIYLYGRVEYRDAFKKKRFTNFRLRYTGQFPPASGATLNFSESGNEAD